MLLRLRRKATVDVHLMRKTIKIEECCGEMIQRSSDEPVGSQAPGDDICLGQASAE